MILSFNVYSNGLRYQYMGFAFLDKYDVNACAQLCNTRNADPNGGACQYFNIWRALVNGIPTTYTCSMVRVLKFKKAPFLPYF